MHLGVEKEKKSIFFRCSRYQLSSGHFCLQSGTAGHRLWETVPFFIEKQQTGGL
jgi:hypothetical protein